MRAVRGGIFRRSRSTVAYGSSERGREANRCSGDDERATWAGGTSYDTRTRHAGHAKVLLSTEMPTCTHDST